MVNNITVKFCWTLSDIYSPRCFLFLGKIGLSMFIVVQPFWKNFPKQKSNLSVECTDCKVALTKLGPSAADKSFFCSALPKLSECLKIISQQSVKLVQYQESHWHLWFVQERYGTLLCSVRIAHEGESVHPIRKSNCDLETEVQQNPNRLKWLIMKLNVIVLITCTS